MKKWEYIRLCIFTFVGILVMIFYKTLYRYVNDIVGTVMIVYGIEEICFSLFSIKKERENEKITSGSILIVLGLVELVLLKGEKNFESACVIWAVWAILREGKELSEVIRKITKKHPFVINASESIVSLVLSVLLILEPKGHAHVHLILLGIELVSKVWFEFVDYLFDKREENLDKVKLKGEKKPN